MVRMTNRFSQWHMARLAAFFLGVALITTVSTLLGCLGLYTSTRSQILHHILNDNESLEVLKTTGHFETPSTWPIKSNMEKIDTHSPEVNTGAQMVDNVISFPSAPLVDWDPPTFVPELLAAPPMTSWETPQLEDGNALLFLHIFSTRSPKSRNRRNLIRQFSPLDILPQYRRNLVEVNFILGRPNQQAQDDSEVVQEEGEIRREIEMYNDIVELDGLLGGDNMDEGKSWEWLRWVGTQQGRQAQWVFKCDDDALPILPNLLDQLVRLESSQPTYFGGVAPGQHNSGLHYYFQGQMYGFTWNVVKTIAAAKKAPKEVVQLKKYEDARIGELMFSLPTTINCEEKHPASMCNHQVPPPNGWQSYTPLSPDPRTGLVRHDFVDLMGPKGWYWVAKVDRAVGWHPLKDNEDYIAAYKEVKQYFVRGGLPIWDLPESLP